MAFATLRPAQRDDAASLARIYAPYVENSVISFEASAPTAAQMARRLGIVERHGPWLVCEAGGAVCGYAYLSRHHERAAYQWSADCAVYVEPARHRQGLGRALYTTLFALAKLQGFHAVHAGVTLPNAASVGLHEAFGFVPVAVYPRVGYKHGAWRDVGWWQLELRERQGEPPALLTPELAQRVHAAAWSAAFADGERLLAHAGAGCSG